MLRRMTRPDDRAIERVEFLRQMDLRHVRTMRRRAKIRLRKEQEQFKRAVK
jgi:hypothetical protein